MWRTQEATPSSRSRRRRTLDELAAIATGEESAQAAFIAGRLRVGGDLRQVMDRAGALATLTDVFAPARGSASGA